MAFAFFGCCQLGLKRPCLCNKQYYVAAFQKLSLPIPFTSLLYSILQKNITAKNCYNSVSMVAFPDIFDRVCTLELKNYLSRVPAILSTFFFYIIKNRFWKSRFCDERAYDSVMVFRPYYSTWSQSEFH